MLKGKTMQSIGDIFAEEEARLLDVTKAEIARENARYTNDPEYRATVEARRAAWLNEAEAVDEAEPVEEYLEGEDENDDQGEQDE